jgi:hypothetical protein
MTPLYTHVCPLSGVDARPKSVRVAWPYEWLDMSGHVGELNRFCRYVTHHVCSPCDAQKKGKVVCIEVVVAVVVVVSGGGGEWWWWWWWCGGVGMVVAVWWYGVVDVGLLDMVYSSYVIGS